ncbi:hypothetical protein [Streptomyces sp. bgisy034]|uniref:hypothetical protein n=1 Tax=Streptomyces sp. bgisy034 TaxID=3413774 RepID=UPI003EBEC7FF
MRIIEEIPEEISGFPRRIEHVAKSEAEMCAVEHFGSQYTRFDIAGYGRRMERDTTLQQSLSYLNGVAAIPCIDIRTGLRQGSDGFHNSVFLLGSTNRPLAAVASLDVTVGLQQRLNPEEVGEAGGLPIHIPQVPADGQNVVERPLDRDEPVDSAIRTACQ